MKKPKRLILPSNPSPSGALPRRFRRLRLLVVGCGDVGMRVVRLLSAHAVNIRALTSTAEKVPLLREAGVRPLLGNLDQPESLARLAGWAQAVLHLAPPPNTGRSAERGHDSRTRALLNVLLRKPFSQHQQALAKQDQKPIRLVYGSTTGVYGDCQGMLINETRRVNPGTARAVRRVDAEWQLRTAGRESLAQLAVHILRIPGIYAPDREGGTPRSRLLRGLPVLQAGDDVFTSHIHANDLARACLAALWRGKPQRISHASCDTRLKMGDYMDWAADYYQLPRPARISRAEAETVLPAMQMSFLRESRQLDNHRLKTELKVVLRYPSIHTGLLEA